MFSLCVCVCVHVHVCLCVWVCTCMHVCVCLCTCTWVHGHACRTVCVCACARAHVHVLTHTSIKCLYFDLEISTTKGRFQGRWVSSCTFPCRLRTLYDVIDRAPLYTPPPHPPPRVLMWRCMTSCVSSNNLRIPMWNKCLEIINILLLSFYRQS